MLITIEQLCQKYGIAITGGIATGKSTITKWLAQLGYQTYDAEQITHSLLLAKEKKTFLKKNDNLCKWTSESHTFIFVYAELFFAFGPPFIFIFPFK